MTLLVGVLLASLAGSVHCAAMCGAFVCAYAVPRGPDASTGGSAHVAYHGGRLFSYLALGAVAGVAGSGLERIGALAGVGRAAAIVAGALMMLWAASEVARQLGARIPVLKADGAGAGALLGRLLATQRDASAPRRALALGVLTTLIPCGWLYAFVATAAATGTLRGGLSVMAVFWAGTIPMLLVVAFGSRRVLAGAGRRWPVVAAIAVMVLGLLTVSGRIRPLDPARAAEQHAGH